MKLERQDFQKLTTILDSRKRECWVCGKIFETFWVNKGTIYPQYLLCNKCFDKLYPETFESIISDKVDEVLESPEIKKIINDEEDKTMALTRNDFKRSTLTGFTTRDCKTCKKECEFVWINQNKTSKLYNCLCYECFDKLFPETKVIDKKEDLKMEKEYVDFPEGSSLAECQEIARENMIICSFYYTYNHNLHSDICNFAGGNKVEFAEGTFLKTKNMELKEAHSIVGSDIFFVLILREKQKPKLCLEDIKEGMLVSELKNVELRPRERVELKFLNGVSIMSDFFDSDYGTSLDNIADFWKK